MKDKDEHKERMFSFFEKEVIILFSFLQQDFDFEPFRTHKEPMFISLLARSGEVGIDISLELPEQWVHVTLFRIEAQEQFNWDFIAKLRMLMETRLCDLEWLMDFKGLKPNRLTTFLEGLRDMFSKHGLSPDSLKVKLERAAYMLKNNAKEFLKGDPSAWEAVETERAKEMARRRLNYITILFVDLKDLRDMILSYIEARDGKIPDFDTRITSNILEALHKEYSQMSDRINKFYERAWDYYIPEDIVGKNIKDLKPNQPFIKIRSSKPKYSKWYIDVSGRLLEQEE